MTNERRAEIHPPRGHSRGLCGRGRTRLRRGGLTLTPTMQRIFRAAEGWTKFAQRTLLLPGQLAREYPASDISPVFKANGTLNPGTDEYAASAANNFIDWRLKIDGLVAHPMSLSVAQIKKAARAHPDHAA